MMPAMKIAKLMGVFIVKFGYQKEIRTYKTIEGVKRLCRKEFAQHKHYGLNVSMLYGEHNREQLVAVYKEFYNHTRFLTNF